MNIQTSTYPSSPREWLRAAGRWLKSHRFLSAAVFAAIVGLAAGWNWLLATGLLFSLLSVLPCLLLFALCMRGMNSGSAKDASADNADAPRLLTKQSTASMEEHSNA